MGNRELPRANTPRILERKKKRSRTVWIFSLSACALLLALFLISIRTAPRAPFLLSVSLLIAVVLILFFTALFYLHIRLFPEFDYGSRTKAEIRTLPVSPHYLQKRRKSRIRQAVFAALLIVCVAAALVPPVLFRSVPFALSMLPSCCAVLVTRLLAGEIHNRRQLEFFKYTML